MRKGFTLVEIMIVVAIIVLLAAIAIPNLLRARVNANEAAAVAALHTISSAAQSYRGANPNYPAGLSSMAAPLATPPYIDTVLGCVAGTSGAICAKQGYSFSVTGAANSFTATARPSVAGTTGVRGFFVDESGVIHWTNTSGATPVVGDSVLE